MTHDEAMAAARSIAEAHRSFVDDLLAKVDWSKVPAPVEAVLGGSITTEERARRFDALTNPTCAADYAVTLKIDDYMAEVERRGMARPEWLP